MRRKPPTRPRPPKPAPVRALQTPKPGACPSRPLPDYASRMVGAEETTIDYWPGLRSHHRCLSRRRQEASSSAAVFWSRRIPVLTAAHCLDGLTRTSDGKPWRRISGALWSIGVLTNQDKVAADGPATRATVVRGDVYAEGAEKYDKRTYRNDIAILKLDRAMTGQPLARIAGSAAANPALDHHLMWAAGFGKQTSTQKRRRVPHEQRRHSHCRKRNPARMRLFPSPASTTASPRWASTTLEDARQLCAGWNRGGRDTCAGDSGGPLIALDGKGCPYVVGVTSFWLQERLRRRGHVWRLYPALLLPRPGSNATRPARSSSTRRPCRWGPRRNRCCCAC